MSKIKNVYNVEIGTNTIYSIIDYQIDEILVDD